MPRKQPNMQKPPATIATNEPRRITRLSELAPRTVDVVIDRPDGQESVVIPCRELTYKRFYEIGRLVPEPIPAIKPETLNYTHTEKGDVIPVYNTDWYAHKQAVADAETRRTMWRLTEFVDLEFESDDVEARVSELENTLPNDVVQALVMAMRTMVYGSEARVEERASSFQRNGTSRNGDLSADGVVARAVVRPL